jgi:hypothetical protein
MFDLHHSPAGNVQFARWCPFSLFYKLMQHHDPAFNQGAVKDARYTLSGLESQLKQAFTHRPGMRHARIGTMNFHALGITQEARDKSRRQPQNFLLQRLVVKMNMPRHSAIIANMILIERAGSGHSEVLQADGF